MTELAPPYDPSFPAGVMVRPEMLLKTAAVQQLSLLYPGILVWTDMGPALSREDHERLTAETEFLVDAGLVARVGSYMPFDIGGMSLPPIEIQLPFGASMGDGNWMPLDDADRTLLNASRYMNEARPDVPIVPSL